MDMDTSHNWLGFSLSHQPCDLLEAFSTSPAHHHGRLEGTDEETNAAAELAALAGMAPKFEDFLGGPAVRYHCENGGNGVEGMYDSGLKTIAAAGFPRGPSAERQETETSKELTAPADSKKAVDTFGQRTSIYRGVTRHRWTGRYEAHLWDNSCRREGQSRKGRQVYLGGYDKEEKAARAYDLAALKYWGPTTTTNFPISNYDKEVEEMKNMTRQEFVASLRRKSSGFSRGASIYRGVTRHHQHGRWQARIGRVAGNKDLYLGTFSTQEEAAEAYDIAAIKFRGLNAVTNFDISRYDVKSIINSNLPIGGVSGRTSKASESSSSSSSEAMSLEAKQHMDFHDSTSVSLGLANFPVKQDPEYWSLLAFHQQQQQQLQLQQQQHSNQNPGFGLFSSGVTMDFSVPSSGVINQTNEGSLVWNNGILEQQQQQQDQSQSSNGSCSSIPYATPIAYGSGGYNYEGSSNMGTWAAPPSYYHQAAKPNVTVFQTPIYGIE